MAMGRKRPGPQAGARQARGRGAPPRLAGRHADGGRAARAAATLRAARRAAAARRVLLPRARHAARRRRRSCAAGYSGCKLESNSVDFKVRWGKERELLHGNYSDTNRTSLPPAATAMLYD